MIHNYCSISHPIPPGYPEGTKSGAHWAVGHNEACILLQTADNTDQTRIMLTPEEALEVALDLISHVHDFNQAKAIETCK